MIINILQLKSNFININKNEIFGGSSKKEDYIITDLYQYLLHKSYGFHNNEENKNKIDLIQPNDDYIVYNMFTGMNLNNLCYIKYLFKLCNVDQNKKIILNNNLYDYIKKIYNKYSTRIIQNQEESIYNILNINNDNNIYIDKNKFISNFININNIKMINNNLDDYNQQIPLLIVNDVFKNNIDEFDNYTEIINKNKSLPTTINKDQNKSIITEILNNKLYNILPNSNEYDINYKYNLINNIF